MLQKFFRIFFPNLAALLLACEPNAAPPKGAAIGENEAPSSADSASEPTPHEERVRASGQLGPGKGTLLLSIQAPAGGKLTEGAPLVLEGSGAHVHFTGKISQRLQLADLPLRVPIEVDDGATEPVALNLKYYWCGEGVGAACRPERVRLLVDLDFSGDAAGGEAFIAHQARIN